MAVVVLIAACSRGNGPSPLSGSESITVALPLTLHSALVLIAAEKRYFERRGLEVTLKPMASGAAAVGAVARGEVDIGLNSETAFVLAALVQRDLRIVATIYQSRNNTSLIARKDRGIANATDLSGKRIGVVSNTGADFFADLYLALHVARPGKITRVPVAVNDAARALIDGDVDAVALFYPHNARLVARLGERAVVFTDPAVYQMRFNVVARSQFSGARSEAARRFVMALNDALTFLQQNADEARRLTMTMAKEDPALFNKVWDTSDFVLGLDQSLLSVLDDEARWALARMPRPEMKQPDVLQFIDARPLQSVVPAAVSVLLP